MRAEIAGRVEDIRHRIDGTHVVELFIAIGTADRHFVDHNDLRPRSAGLAGNPDLVNDASNGSHFALRIIDNEGGWIADAAGVDKCLGVRGEHTLNRGTLRRGLLVDVAHAVARAPLRGGPERFGSPWKSDPHMDKWRSRAPGRMKRRREYIWRSKRANDLFKSSHGGW